MLGTVERDLCLSNLGWNVSERFPAESPARVVLVEYPFHLPGEGLREVHLSGVTGDDAIEAFLNEDVPVRVRSWPKQFATRDGQLLVAICVDLIAPLPGEAGDQWFIVRTGIEADAFVLAEETTTQFNIKRRDARLLHCDVNGRRLVHRITNRRLPIDQEPDERLAAP